MDIFNRIKNMKILLVDDDEWIRDSLSLFFEAEGCELLTFETAEEAWKPLHSKPMTSSSQTTNYPAWTGWSFLDGLKKNNRMLLKF